MFTWLTAFLVKAMVIENAVTASAAFKIVLPLVPVLTFLVAVLGIWLHDDLFTRVLLVFMVLNEGVMAYQLDETIDTLLPKS